MIKDIEFTGCTKLQNYRCYGNNDVSSQNIRHIVTFLLTSEMRKISREKVERMRNMILECFSAKYFSSPGSWIRFYSVAKWKYRNSAANQMLNCVSDDKIAKPIKCVCFGWPNSETNQMLVFWRIFSPLWKSRRFCVFVRNFSHFVRR